MRFTRNTVDQVLKDSPPGRQAALGLADCDELARLSAAARQLRDQARPAILTYSRQVFIPLSGLCRDVCDDRASAGSPKRLAAGDLSPLEVLGIARRGAAAGCEEALFSLVEKPGLRDRAARKAVNDRGYPVTIAHLRVMADLVRTETGLLPHLNAGTLTRSELRMLRPVVASMGIMLESASRRPCSEGSPHQGMPDSQPGVRLATIARAGAERVPLNSGILIGIGETRRERIETLLALRELHGAYGHIQNISVQHVRFEPGTLMAGPGEPAARELLWTLAVARVIFGADMSIQAPPDLAEELLGAAIETGIDDLGGVSPFTPDHVDPEASWPEITRLERVAAEHGKNLAPRLPIYPAYIEDPETWVAPQLQAGVLRGSDAAGLARECAWSPGTDLPIPNPARFGQKSLPLRRISALTSILNRAQAGRALYADQVTTLFNARGDGYRQVCRAADELRRDLCGDTVTYVVNRNINYTNICSYRCTFCAFSKGRGSKSLRGPGYNMSLDEIRRRSLEAWNRGATEVCLQGGIHPAFTGQTYLDITSAIRGAVPEMHIHAFSALEIWQGAETLGCTVQELLERLRSAGLGSMPGTAAEILDDDVRRIICPDKIGTDQWLEVIATAHRVGIPTTATIMFGHVDHPRHWARHLLRLRDLQLETGGLTEFVPLPFVHMEAPVYRGGRARMGPTFREVVLMHAVARLVFHRHLTNIQASWPKLGVEGVRMLLDAGVNDVGGTLMNESISRAAGAAHGQEMTADRLVGLIADAGRTARQRTTLYDPVPKAGTRRRAGAAGAVAARERAASGEGKA